MTDHVATNANWMFKGKIVEYQGTLWELTLADDKFLRKVRQ